MCVSVKMKHVYYSLTYLMYASTIYRAQKGPTFHNRRTFNYRKKRVATRDENGRQARVWHEVIQPKAAGAMNRLS